MEEIILENVTLTMEPLPDPGYMEIPSTLATSIGATVMLVFFIQAIVGNVWILVAIAMTRKIWNVINIIIVSLCFNDLLSLGLILVLIIDSYIWRRWTAGSIMCKLNPELTVAFTGCSLWHTCLIAIHRYIVVVHSDAYKRLSKKAYVVFVLVAARAIPFACTFPGFTLETSGYVPKLLRCILLPGQSTRIMTITIVQIIIPCVLVILCYAMIFGFVVKTSWQTSSHSSNMMLRREIQITKMFGVIFLMILLGFVPYGAVRNADKGFNFSAYIYVIVTVCYGVAICSSPLVYGVMSTDIRSACTKTYQKACFALTGKQPKPNLDTRISRTSIGLTELPEKTTQKNMSVASSPLSNGVGKGNTGNDNHDDDDDEDEKCETDQLKVMDKDH